ncbi:MAG: hypothetical protein ACLR7Z_18260 [Bilophila wadsworthia]
MPPGTGSAPVLTRDILPFLFMGQATKHELRRMDETARRNTNEKPRRTFLPGLLASCLNFEGFRLFYGSPRSA